MKATTETYDLHFDEKTHTYTSNNKKLTSVTQVINKYSDKFDADLILDKMFEANQGQKLYIGKTRKYVGMTKEEIKTQWKINSESKSRYGTFIHELAEDIGNGKKVDVKLPEINQVRKFFDKEGFEIIEQELRIHDYDIEIAGTVDLLLKKDGLYYIYDWKTNCGKDLTLREDVYKKYLKAPLNNIPSTSFWKYSLQMSLYRYMLQLKHPDWEFGDSAILHLINGVADLKTEKGRIYPEMSRATYKIIKTPYMVGEVKSIIEDLDGK